LRDDAKKPAVLGDEETADATLREAEQSAASVVSEARRRAELLLSKAREDALRVVERARETVAELYETAPASNSEPNVVISLETPTADPEPAFQIADFQPPAATEDEPVRESAMAQGATPQRVDSDIVPNDPSQVYPPRRPRRLRRRSVS